MNLLTDSDRQEADSLGEYLRSRRPSRPEWDDESPFTPEETSGWVTVVLGIGLCLVLMFITAVAVAPHI